MRRLVAYVLTGLVGVSQIGYAQDYPTRPVRLVVPFAPGGTADLIGRPLAQKMGEILGQNFISDNRGGAGGVLGATVVAKAPADGYHLLLGSSGALTISPSLMKLAYDPLQDFAPVGVVAISQFILVVHPSLPATDVASLINLAKSKPGRLSFGSAGKGNVGHLAAELFNSMAGVNILHVPYKGAGPMTVDLLAGHVDLAFPGLASLVPHVKSGRVRALAVTGSTRSSVLPQLPTLHEAGLKGYEARTFWGLLAPAKTSPDIVQRLSVALEKAVKSPELRTQYTNGGNEPTHSTPKEFADLMRSDIGKWAKVIKAAGLSTN